MAGWNGAFYNGVFTCGFDMLTTASMSQVMINGQGSISATDARFGDGQSFQAGGFGANGFALLVNLARGIDGFYVVPTLPGSGFTTICYWYDATAGTIQLELRVGSLGQLQFFLGTGSTTVGSASANGVLATGRGAYIQTDVTINSSTGIVKAYVDTSGASAVISSTGVNTQSSANAYFNQFLFQNNNFYFDDFYMLDLTGSAPFNAILGPGHEHWDPAASDASPNNFSTNPSQTSGNHYKNVDSVTTPSGTAYNFSNTPTQDELYGFPNLTAAQVIAMTEWIYSE